MEEKKTACWNLQVPKSLDKAVDKAVLSDWHYTKTEFIRDAVRQKLNSMGIKPLFLQSEGTEHKEPPKQ